MKCVPTKPVGRRTADGEAAGEQPEHPTAAGVTQRHHGHPGRVVGQPRLDADRFGGGGAVGRDPQVAGVVVKAPEHEGHDQHRARGGRDGRRPPAVVLGQPREQGEEGELAGRPGGGEDAADHAAVLDEPPVGDDGDEGHRHGPGAQADEDAPAEDELPGRRHPHGQQRPDTDQRQGGGDDPLDAEALHERGGEGGRQSEQDEVDRHGEADEPDGPAELVVQRGDEHPWRGAEPGGADRGEEGDDGDPPCRVDPRRHPRRVRRAAVGAVAGDIGVAGVTGVTEGFGLCHGVILPGRIDRPRVAGGT